MLRRSHKKSRAGCKQCRQRHVKCDESHPACMLCVNSDRECSFRNEKGTQKERPIFISALKPNAHHTAAPAIEGSASEPQIRLCLPSNDSSLSEEQGEVDLDHMELLIHLSLNKDIFNLGFGVDEYHPSSLMLALSTNLRSPVLMHQLLAFSSRHLAHLRPERFAFYNHQAVALQTKAISLFNATFSITQIDRSNCIATVLFASVLGHHTLTDALAWRMSGGIQGFVQHYVQCIETQRGICTIATSAWPMLMESELEPVFSLSQAFTSREPRGQHCKATMDMIRSSRDLDGEQKESCLSALRYLQVGFDAATAENEEKNRHHMVCTWPMLITPVYASLLAALRAEALIILAHYAELLHHARDLWQVRDAGTYLLGLTLEYLDDSWAQWLEPARQTIFGHVDGVVIEEGRCKATNA